MSRLAAAPVVTWRPTFGAVPEDRATTFGAWATAARDLTLVYEEAGSKVVREVRCDRQNDKGFFRARVEGAGHGTRYSYRIDGGQPFPDPASRFQPEGVHGPSQVVDWTRFQWTDRDWRGVRFDDLVIYELHVGTFTPAGTFAGVIDRLPYLAHLGISAIELMPVAAFAGRRNWGYDGAALYAPAAAYGAPEDLRRLVDAAHRAGIAVIADVVYNHLGPDGAYLSAFSPEFFSPRHQSPWGDGVNLDGEGNAHARRFLIENAFHWVHEYHVDGLRLDATHALSDEGEKHLLAELADAVHSLDVGRPVHLIAEDERNLATLVRPPTAGGFGLDGVWSDDFHHQVHRVLTGEREGYYADFSDSMHDVATTVNRGWFYTGQATVSTGRPRGTDPSGVRRPQLVFCLQNHDQVGNRALGERLTHLVDLASCRAAAALLLLAPQTPLLFMGEEWAASTPFLYFTDHHDELGRLVTEGRRREFARFAAFSDPTSRDRIPDPQAATTFEASRLRWEEIRAEPHASMLRLYRALLTVRRRLAAASDNGRPIARALDADTLLVERTHGGTMFVLVARFRTGGSVLLPADVASRPELRVTLTTEDTGFVADARPPVLHAHGHRRRLEFARPSAVVLTGGLR